jgi:hypothetical protein
MGCGASKSAQIAERNGDRVPQPAESSTRAADTTASGPSGPGGSSSTAVGEEVTPVEAPAESLASSLADKKETIEAAIATGQSFAPDVQAIIDNAGLSELVSAAGEAKAEVFGLVREGVCSALPWIMSAVDVVGPAVPFFAPVFSLVTKAYGAVCAMKEVKEQVQVLRTSLEGLANDLFQAMQSYKAAIDPELLPALKAKLADLKIADIMQEVNTFLDKQLKCGSGRKFLRATTDAESVKALSNVRDPAVQLHDWFPA